jgi:hypothetical protein
VVDRFRASAVACLAIGAAGLILATIRSDAVGRALGLFSTGMIVMAVLWARFGPPGRVRRLAPRAGTPPHDAVVLASSDVRRWVWIAFVPVAVMVGTVMALDPGGAAAYPGITAGIGAGELWGLRWARRYEAECREQILMPAPRVRFSRAERVVYTRPMNDVTDVT